MFALRLMTIFLVFFFSSAINVFSMTNANQPMNTANNKILTRLPNGLLVYLIQDKRFPLVCSRLYVRAGSAMENPAQAGISHVLEHMVFKGTSHRPKGEAAREVESLGGYINAATSFDKTWYIADMPKAYWQKGIDVIKDMAFQAVLAKEYLNAEKEVVISELKRGEDSPMRKLFESLQTASLKNTPYGRPIIGYEDTIRSLTAEDLKAYVKRWYQPQNMMMLVAGDINLEDSLDYITKVFGTLANSSDMEIPPLLDIAEAEKGSAIAEVVRGPWNKVYLGLSFPAPDIRDSRSLELDLLCYLLGGDATSLLYKKFKYENQLVDSIDVSNMSLARAGLASITAQLEPGKVTDFWEALTNELGTLSANIFPAEAIARAKFNLFDDMDRAGETLNGLAAWEGTIQFDLGGEQAEKNMRFTLGNINQTQIQNCISAWLNPDRARIRIYAPQDAKLPDFEKILKKNWVSSVKIKPNTEKITQNSTQETIDLNNGCKLILLPDNSAPYISLEFMMTGGNAMLKPDQQGLANLTARLLQDGCGSMSKPVLDRYLAERAASLSARSGIQTFSLTLTGPSRFNADYFGLLQDVLRKPKFDPADFRREAEDIKAAIRQRNDQPLSYLFSKLVPFLFPDGQPYGFDNLGADKYLDTFNVMNVRDFWTKQSGQPWVLAAAGSFDKDQIVQFAKTLPAPRSEKINVASPVWTREKNLALALPGRNQAHLMQIFKTVPQTEPDAPGLMLLESALSGQSGLLFTRLRDDKGLGYSVTAFNRPMPLAGYMTFYIGTSPEKIEDAKKGFNEIIAGLKKEPLPEPALKAAANRLLGDYLRSRQSLSARAKEAATNAILNYPQDFEKILIEQAAKTNPNDIRSLAVKYFVEPYEVVLLP